MSDFLTDIADRVLTIRLNRPSKRNALTRAMYSGIAETLNAARSDDQVRVVLLAGSPQCFSAGNDLQDATVDGLDGDHGCFMRALMSFPKPVVAAPSGIAVGIGVTMLLHCDLVYCGEQTTFRVPFVPLAVCPEFGSSWLLPRLVGHQRASEILLAGEPFDANAAHQFGIVNDILPNEQVHEFARAKAVFIAAQPPAAVRTTKMLLKRANRPDVLEAMAIEMEHLVTLQYSAEAGEAIAAFREKRRPDFSNFA
jgi:enoyl-CoA hydratase/carnithine racemase